MGRPRNVSNVALPRHLYRRTDGRFYFRDPRNQRTFSLGRDEVTARAQAEEVNRSLGRLGLRLGLIDRIDGCAPQTLAAWLGQYDALLAADRSLSAATLKQYRSMSRQLCEVLGHAVLAELQPQQIAQALARWQSQGLEKRAHALLAFLRRACSTAIGQGWLAVGRNPTQGLRIKTLGVVRQRLSLDEFHQLHAAAARHERWVQRWLELAVLTTLRLADLLAVCWHRGESTARGWVDGSHLRVRTAKRNVPIAIPLSLSLPPAGRWTIATVLDAIRSDGVASPWVIRRSGEQRHSPPGATIRPRAVETVFAKLVSEAGIRVAEGFTRPTPHELRSLGLRLHRGCHGREFARHLGTHSSEQTADLYQDPRGAGWLMIPLPPRPSAGRLAAARASADRPADHP